MSSAVIPQTTAPPKPFFVQPTDQKVQLLPIDEIVPSKTNPRTSYDQESLNGLAQSIAAQGLIQAIVVRPIEWVNAKNETEGGEAVRFEIVCGHRRYMAVKQLGLKSIPAIVRELSDREVIEIQVTENEQREDVKPLEQARGYQSLIDQYVKDEPKATRAALIDKVAQRVGMSVRHVYARLKLTELDPAVKEALDKGVIEASHADVLVTLPAKEQKQVFTECFGEDAPRWYREDPPSVRDLQEIIEERFQPLKEAPFELDDPRLTPSCVGCEFKKGTDEKPLCAKQECYDAKIKGFIEIETKAITEKLGREPLRVSDSYRPDKKGGYLGGGTWKKVAKKSCEHAAPAIKVDYNGKPVGIISAVCAENNCKVHGAKAVAAQKAAKNKPTEVELQREQQKKEAELAGDRALLTAVLGQVKQVGATELRFFAEQLANLSDIGYDGIDLIAQFFDWKKSGSSWQQIGSWIKTHVPKMTPVQLAQFVIATIAGESIGGDYGTFSREDLDGLAKQYKLDPKAVRQQAADAVLKPVQTSAAAKPKAGTCRICGCTEGHACVLKNQGANKPPLTCKWADKTKTLCTNPECLKKAGAQVGAKVSSLGPSSKPKAKPAKKSAAAKGGRK